MYAVRFLQIATVMYVSSLFDIESMQNAGVGAEVAASIQEGSFLKLEAPVQRVAGWDTHTGLVWEKFVVPDVARIYDAIKKVIEY